MRRPVYFLSSGTINCVNMDLFPAFKDLPYIHDANHEFYTKPDACFLLDTHLMRFLTMSIFEWRAGMGGR